MRPCYLCSPFLLLLLLSFSLRCIYPNDFLSLTSSAWLQKSFEQFLDTAAWSHSFVPSLPMQVVSYFRFINPKKNCFDCGVFVCIIASDILHSSTSGHFKTSSLQKKVESLTIRPVRLPVCVCGGFFLLAHVLTDFVCVFLLGHVCVFLLGHVCVCVCVCVCLSVFTRSCYK